jgi:hypothetical protein
MPRRRTTHAAPLTLAMMDFLLDGRTRHPDDVPDGERAGYDHFLEFDDWPAEKLEAAWQTHGDALRAEQRRRAVDGAPR